MTEPLRRLMRRAADHWGEPVQMIRWRDHMLREPTERVRELRAAPAPGEGFDEEARLLAELPALYRPLVTFLLRTGRRVSEALGLDEAHVDWGARSYAFTAKGGEVRHKPMATEVRDLLWRQRPPEGRGGPMFRGATGERIQYEALASAFRRAARRAGVADFRIHDLRHTQATRLLRRTGNLALVAASLDHANVETTMRYAHVLDADLRAALDGAEVPAKSPTVKPEAAKRKAKSTA